MKYYVVDVFTKELFRGNPAGVCLVEESLEASVMQSIAFENNLAETAFIEKREDGSYNLRWFTPEVEIDLCGHATLGSAYVLMNYVDPLIEKAVFHTQSGILTVVRNGELYAMNLPSRKPIPCEIPSLLEKVIGIKVLETFMSRDLVVLVENEKAIIDMQPDYNLFKQLDQFFGIIITAKGDTYDFVSRYFAPNAGIPEDPVTGSSHSTLIPFWSERLDKKVMTAAQLSRRGGLLYCKDLGDRVEISGTAITYLMGDLNVNASN